MRLCEMQELNRESERIHYGRGSLQLAAGILNHPAAEKSRLHPPPNPCYQATRIRQQLIGISSLLK
jgi:hypothetical protein